MNIPPGIYFGLPEADYHAAPALGSGDMKRLAASPARFWWEKAGLNPLWKPYEHTPATRLGAARHCIAFYGEKEFARRYGRKTLNWSTKEGKEERDDFALNDLEPLPEDDYDRTLLTRKLIEANPYFAETFAEPIAHEVSVFWNSPQGIPKKARFDGLKVRSIVDLKNIANEREIDFRMACLRYLHNYSAHVQAEHYREARLAMKDLMKAFPFRKANRLLLDCAASAEWAFVFIFLQKTGAPEVEGLQLTYREFATGESEKNPIFDVARRVLDRADTNYLRCVEKFGTSAAWIEPKPITELDSSQMSLPSWFLRAADWESV